MAGLRVDKTMNQCKISAQAEVAEQADALRSGRSSLHGSVGSTPTFGTNNLWVMAWRFFVRDIEPV
jgi:hypothetical protein